MTDSQTSANHPKQPRRLLALQRRRTALSMRLAGADVEEIAASLGVTKGRVSQLIGEAMVDLTAAIGMDAEKYREIVRRNIFRAMARLEKSLASSDAGEAMAAADRLNRQNERLAKLEGLDAPEKQQVELKEILIRYADRDNTPDSA